MPLVKDNNNNNNITAYDDKQIQANRPNIVLINKTGKVIHIIDIAVPAVVM